jgi:hypothetical protein
MRRFACLTLLLGIFASEGAWALTIELPPDTAMLKPATSTAAANIALCAMCHSLDYILSQPLMPLGFWQAEVEKMVSSYGAPIPAAQIPEIINYLNQAYGPSASQP